MKIRDLKKIEPRELEPGTSVLLQKHQRKGEDDLFEKGGGSRLSPSTDQGPPSGTGTFAQAVLGCFRRHPKAVAAVLSALMVPALLAPLPSVSPIHADETAVVTTSIATPAFGEPRILQAAIAEVPGSDASALSAYVQSIREQLQHQALSTRADGIEISVITPPGATQGDAIRALVHERFGVAPGAELKLVDLGGQIFNARHRALTAEFEKETIAVRAGADPSQDWAANAIAIELFETAESIYRLHHGKSDGKTEIAVLGRSTSPRSIALKLMDHLRAAPEGSAARALLNSLPSTDEDGTEVDAWQGLTRVINEVAATESGSRRINEGKRALRTQYTEARKKGVLVFRPSGDLRRPGDEETYRSGRDFTDGFEAPIAVGATELPKGDKPPAILENTSTGWMAVAGPGVEVPSLEPEGLDGSLAATLHVAGAAALMLKAAPDLSPDQLESLLTDPSVLIDQAGTRDGLGFVQTAKAVSLAREASLGKIEFTSDRSRFLYQKVVKGGPEIEASHPYAQHIAHLRAELTARGLPTRGDGVKVFVVEPGWDDHVGAVSRTITHPEVGLAPGADVHVIVDSDWYNDRERSLSKNDVAHDKAVLAGALPTEQAVIDIAERQILSRAADIRKVASLAPGNETVLMNMSYGTTSATIAENLVDLMESAPKGSAAEQKVEGLGEERSERDQAMVEWVADVLSSPKAKAQIRPALDALTKELRSARDKRVLAFGSAGNSREDWMNRPAESAHVEAGVDDLITVSAVKINNPQVLGDESPTDFTSEGHIIFGAPGEDMPIGLRGDVKGTSFSSPYGLSVGVLMVKANPELLPDQLEALLYRPSSTFNIPGHLDGLGVIDVVASVQAADDARASGFEWLSKSEYFQLRKLRLQQTLSPTSAADES